MTTNIELYFSIKKMNRYIFLTLFGLFSIGSQSFAQQSVGIGTSSPNPRAVLQLVSPGQNQGFLLPKLTTTQITTLGGSLSATDIGLMVYDSLLQQIRYWNGTAWLTVSTATSLGTVTSVGLSLPSIFTVSGSPVTTTGTLTGSLANQTANTIFAGPSTGVPAAPTFRSLVANDIPNLDAAKITTGTLPITIGGTNGTATPTAGAVAYGTGTAYAFTGVGSSGQILQSNGTLAPTWVNPPTFSGWGLTGNAGTNPATNYIGTSDLQPLRLATNGVERLRVSTTGVLGINNINPGAVGFNPTLRLDVTGSIRTQRDGVNGEEGGEFALGEPSLAPGGGTGNWILDAYFAGGVNKLRLLNSRTGNNHLNITDNGTPFVGIGNFGFAEAALATLDVKGNVKITDGTQAAGRVLTSDALGYASWQVLPASNAWSLSGNAGTVAGTNFIGTTDAIDFRIRTSNLVRLSITAGGNVGIGTISPDMSLEIRRESPTLLDVPFGARVFSNDFNSSPDLVLFRGRGTSASPTAVSSGDEIGNIDFRGQFGTLTTNQATGAAISGRAEANWTSATETPTDLRFRTTGAVGGLQERMRITGAGNIGIGTTAPVSALTVENTSNRIAALVSNSTVGTWSEIANNSTGGQVFGMISTGSANGQGVGKLVFTRNVALGSTAGTIMTLVHANSNVGVGTVTPEARFVASQTVSNAGILKVENTGNTNGDRWWIGFNHGGGSADANDRARIGVEAAFSGAGRIFFTTGTGGSQTERMRIDDVGNVGIGTNAPSTQLHTTGGVRFQGLPGGVLTTNAAGVVSVSTAYPTGSGSGGQVAFWTTPSTMSSSPGFFWENADQELGVGLTAPQRILHLHRAANTEVSTRYTNTATGLGIADGFNVGIDSLGNAFFQNLEATSMQFFTNNTERMRILAGGNVGIGTTTPGGRLHVENSDYGTNSMILTSTAASAGATIRFTSPAVGGREYALIGSTGTGASTGAGFFGIFDNTGGAYRMVISPTGAIGFGVTNPVQFMHLFSNSTTTYQKWATTNTGNTATDGFDIGVTAARNVELVQRENAAILLFTDNTERMRITNAGSVGIGTISPSSQASLHVSGGDIAADGTSFFGIKWVTGNTMQAHIHRWGASNNALYVTNAGSSNLTGVFLGSGATSWTSTSDRRLKENIVETGYGLSEILRLSPKEYTFKTTQERNKKIGFLAQEVYQIIPEIVHKGDDGEYRGSGNAEESEKLGFAPWGLDYTSLTPILVKAIQELHQQVEHLQKSNVSGEDLLQNDFQTKDSGLTKSSVEDELNNLKNENIILKQRLLQLESKMNQFVQSKDK